MFFRSQLRFSVSMGRPSSLMNPEEGLYHLSMRPMMVLLPEPLWPWVGQRAVASKPNQIHVLTTKAVTLPAGTLSERLSRTVVPGRVG